MNSVKELIALAKKPGSKLSYGTPGIGNTQHLAGELFNARAGTQIVHVPYKGAGQAITGVLAGEVRDDVRDDAARPAAHPGRAS